MDNQIMALTSIERRINYHMQGACANILEVGRCLNEAKDAGLVAHGDWEQWVRRTTGMSERTAQRLMQAAREVDPASAMAKLPITKIQALLTLPEPEREPMARKAVDDNMSLRQLQGEINRLREQAKQADEARAAAIRKAQEIAREKRTVEQSLKDTEGKLDMAIEEVESAREALKRPHGISAEAQAKIDRLEAKLEDAERMAARQSDLRQQAQQELLEIKSQAARGEAAPANDDLTADAVALAVRTFITSVGFVPHAGMRLSKLGYQERQQLEAYIRMIDRWVRDTRQALNDINEAVVIKEAAEAWAK